MGRVIYVPIWERERTAKESVTLDAATEWLLTEISPEPASIKGLRALAEKELLRPRDALHRDWAKTFLEETKGLEMRRQASVSTPPPKKPLPSKREEVLEAIRQRDALAAILDAIDAIEDLPESVLAQTKRRFKILKK
jgi:hypothetical protein